MGLMQIIALQALATQHSREMGTKVLASSTTDVGFPPEFRWHGTLFNYFDAAKLNELETQQMYELHNYSLGDSAPSRLVYKTDQELDSLNPQPDAKLIRGYKKLRNHLFREPPINIAVWHSGGHWTYDLANSTRRAVAKPPASMSKRLV